MSNTAVSPKAEVHRQRRERIAARNLRTQDNLIDQDIEAEEPETDAPEEKPRGRRLKAEELGLSEDKDSIRIGMTSHARRPIDWHIGQGGNLLIAGYGVPHTSYLLQSIVAHYRQHEVPVYGIDFMDMLNNYPKGTFAGLHSHRRDGAVDLLEKLTTQDTEQVVIISQLGGLLNPLNSTMTPEAQASLREDIIRLLLTLINDDHTHVIISTSKLKNETDLPQHLIDAFTDRVIAGKVFANEAVRLMDEAQKKRSDNASIHHSLLITPSNAEVFQNARVNLIRNY